MRLDGDEKRTEFAKLSTRFSKSVGIAADNQENIYSYCDSPNENDSVEMVELSPTVADARGPQCASPAPHVESAMQYQKICQLAQVEGIPVDQMRAKWFHRRDDLSRDIEMISNGPPGDYEDIKMVVHKIVNSGNWLSAGEMNVASLLVPSWRRADQALTRAIEYISIVQDMKQTCADNMHLSGNIMADLHLLYPFITAKR
jgi:hypothetical protein